MLCHYDVVNFLQNFHKRHPIAHQLGRVMGCLSWVQTLIYILTQSRQWYVQYNVILGCVIMALDCIRLTHLQMIIFRCNVINENWLVWIICSSAVGRLFLSLRNQLCYNDTQLCFGKCILREIICKISLISISVLDFSSWKQIELSCSMEQLF